MTDEIAMLDRIDQLYDYLAYWQPPTVRAMLEGAMASFLTAAGYTQIADEYLALLDEIDVYEN